MSLYRFRVIVRKVYDGDSITVDIDQGFNDWKVNQKLRFYGVNTPEVKGSQKVEGLEFKELMLGWTPIDCEAEMETVEDRHRQDRTGKFGRWLAIVYPPGWKRSANTKLLEMGVPVEAYSKRQEAEVYRRLDVKRVVQ